MFLEVLNDLLMSSSIFYVYFGMLLMTIGISQLLIIQHNLRGPQYEFSLYDVKYVKLRIACSDMPLSSQQLFMNWFVKSFQRIAHFDDDDEDDSVPYFTQYLQIREDNDGQKQHTHEPAEILDCYWNDNCTRISCRMW